MVLTDAAAKELLEQGNQHRREKLDMKELSETAIVVGEGRPGGGVFILWQDEYKVYQLTAGEQ